MTQTMEKKLFIEELGKLISVAKPHLIRCELISKYDADYVRVHTDNNCHYDVCIEANSKIAIIQDVVEAIAYK